MGEGLKRAIKAAKATQVKQRKKGFYWVVYLPKYANEWTVAEYSKLFGWYVVGLGEEAEEKDLIIGEFIGECREFNPNKNTKGQ